MSTERNPTEAKQSLKNAIISGDLSLGQAVRQMRQITGLSQKDFARNIIGVSPRILSRIELDRGNPTLATMNKIARPFGYQIGFIRNH